MNYFIIWCTLFLYLIGAIPTGYLFSYLVSKVDITQHGSRNIGATNVARVLSNKWYFLVILLLDASKAWCALRIIDYINTFYHFGYSPSHLMLMSISLLIGNAYSCFLSYKGGKGVSTSIGILCYFSPAVIMWHLALFAPVFCGIQFMGVSVLITTTLITTWLMITAPSSPLSLLCFFIALWVTFRHTENIASYFLLPPKKG